jgi:hypothetical protein
MLKKILINGVIFIGFMGSLQAMDDIDDFVTDHCGNDCNGESTQCWNCYTGAMDLWQNPFEYPTQDSETDDSDDSDPYGNVGFKF